MSTSHWEDDSGAGGADQPFAPTIDWWALEPAERVEQLGELRLWVARLVVTYEWDANTVPACWERHEAAIRLLDALHRSYLVATHPTQVGESLIGWHHNLVFIRDELKTMFAAAACTSSSHVECRSPSWAVDVCSNGKESQEWKKGQEAAMGAYRQAAVEAAVAAAGA